MNVVSEEMRSTRALSNPGYLEVRCLGSRCTWLNLAIGNGCTLFLIVVCIGSDLAHTQKHLIVPLGNLAETLHSFQQLADLREVGFCRMYRSRAEGHFRSRSGLKRLTATDHYRPGVRLTILLSRN